MRQSRVVARTASKSPKREMKVRIPRTSRLARFFLSRFGRILVISICLLVIGCVGAFAYFYAKYAQMFDEKLRTGLFANASRIFAAPESVSVGDVATPSDIGAQLRRSGYNES